MAIREGNGSFIRHSGEAAEIEGPKYSIVAVVIREEIGSFVRHSGEAAELVGP